MDETESVQNNGTTGDKRGGIVSSEELKHGMSDNTETRSNDDLGFSEWVDSITATQDALKTLVAHPDYSLYQAKEHVRGGIMAVRPASGGLSLFGQLQARYNRGWRKLVKTLTETGEHHHLRRHHHTPG
jgi:hypothetical protein